MSTSEQIDNYIAKHKDWRGKHLTLLRKIINQSAPGLTEEWKWNCPVWTKKGPVCAISGFKSHVKINFFQGVLLEDGAGLFNSGLDSKQHRSINFGEAELIDEPAIETLVRAAVAKKDKS